MADFDFTQLKGRLAQAGKGGHVELTDMERNALIASAMGARELIEVSYAIEGQEMTLDWSAYSFDEIKDLLDSGKFIGVRCLKDGDKSNTFYLYPEGVELGSILTFSGWFLNFYKITATLQRAEKSETGKGDISCAVNSHQVIEP